MFKRKFWGVAFFVFLFVNLMFLSINTFAESGEDYVELFDDTNTSGLDIVWAKDTDPYGIMPVYDGNGDMYAIKTWVTKTRPIIITHKLSQTINDGMLYVSFDYKTTEKFNDSFLRLKSGDIQFQICGFRNSGKFGHFLDFSKWTLDKNTSVDYAPDIWYKVGILFDMSGDRAYLYFGETGKTAQLIETVDIPENFGNITDVVIVQSFGDYTPAMWDNLKVYNVTPQKIENIENDDNLKFETEIFKNYTDVLLNEGFQTETVPNLGFNSWSEADAVWGRQREMTEEGEYALKTWVGTKNPTVVSYSLKSPMNSGVYSISYDWLSKDGYNDSYIRLEKDGTRYQVCGFRNTGTFGKFIDFSKWALNKDTETEYKPDVWYTVSVVMDFDLRNVYIMFGERGQTLSLIEKETMGDEFTGFNNIIFVHSYGDYPEILWDNMKIFKLNHETIGFIEEETGLVFDESVKAELAATLDSDNAGNIFSNAENAEITAVYNNRSLIKSEYDFVYELYYDDEIMFSESKKISVPQNGRVEDKIILPTGNKYGFFTFRVLNGDKTETLAETRFSNVHTATDNVKNDKVGTTLHMTRVEDKAGAFEILEKGGFAIIRGGQNDWKDVETAENVYQTDNTNLEYYTLASENGFENMTILKGSNDLYAEEYPTSNTERVGLVENPPQSDGLIEKFAKYCYETVMRYPQVKYFQIWNEWNNAPVFNLDNITGAEYYAKLLKAGYEAVKQAEKDRGKEALAVAMAPSGTKPAWISQVIDALNGEKCFDIISVHPYTYTDGGENKESTYAPEDVCVRHKTELGDVVGRVQAVKNVLKENGYEDVPVWAGEFGFSSYVCGEEKQAQYAVRMLALNDANNLLDKMLWYTFQNHISSNEKEQNFGMIRYHDDTLVPNEAKPVYIAMSNYNALMANAQVKEKIIDGENGLYLFKFTARDRSNIYTAWTTGECGEFEFKPESKIVEIYDLYGNKTTIFNENGSITLKLSESIAYIKEPVKYAKIIQNGQIVNNISNLTDENFEVVSNTDENYEIILAQYKNDVLINAISYAKGENVPLKRHPEADKITVFFWDNMNPVIDKFILK